MADSDSLALRQWLDFVGLTDSEIGEIRAAAMNSERSLFEYCSSLTDSRIAMIFQALTNTRESVVDPSQFQRSLENFPSLQVNESISTAIAEIVEFLPSIPRMKGHLYEKYGVLDAEEERTDVTGEDEVLVTTMHSAKGLEAEIVFVMWLNRTFIPAKGRVVREEERLLYVALTRAKQDAILTFYEEYDTANHRLLREQAMSPFLRSIRAHLDVQRITAASLNT
ncbi:MAG: ATP-dependent helicase [Chloroflexi bacterium]|nr:ATP-dependent helicase [Chloroflexota bacterium]